MSTKSGRLRSALPVAAAPAALTILFSAIPAVAQQHAYQKNPDILSRVFIHIAPGPYSRREPAPFLHFCGSWHPEVEAATLL